MNEYNVYAHQEASRLELALKAERARAQLVALALAADAEPRPSLLTRLAQSLGRSLRRRAPLSSERPDVSDAPHSSIAAEASDGDQTALLAQHHALPAGELPVRGAAPATIVIDPTDHALAGVIFGKARQHRRRPVRRVRTPGTRARVRLAEEG